MSNEKQEVKRIGGINTVATNKGIFEKLSLELTAIGEVLEKDGHIYLKMPEGMDGLNPYEKDGVKKYYLNLVLNTFKSVRIDTWKPNQDNNSPKPVNAGGNDSLPF